MCGASGSIAAVTKVHCLCDVVAVIFGLGKFLRSDMSTLIKFRVH